MYEVVEALGITELAKVLNDFDERGFTIVEIIQVRESQQNRFTVVGKAN